MVYWPVPYCMNREDLILDKNSCFQRLYEYGRMSCNKIVGDTTHLLLLVISALSSSSAGRPPGLSSVSFPSPGPPSCHCTAWAAPAEPGPQIPQLRSHWAPAPHDDAQRYPGRRKRGLDGASERVSITLTHSNITMYCLCFHSH